ncbi:MAG: hypothetical protein AB8F74_00370, partial [Saprospiraceae bacterium]
MKNVLPIVLTIIFSCNVHAQNLVPNYSFETFSSCPTGLSQAILAQPWVQTSLGTPDYLNACNPDNFSVPSNIFGNQPASTGDAYMGMYCSIGSSISEYITAPLTTPLVAGSCYYGEMYISLGESFSNVGMDKVGMYLTDGFPSAGGGGEIIASPAPQVYGNTVAIDTDNWVQISGVFVADGGESHITLGKFFPDSEVNTIDYVDNPGSNLISYYYVDDVSLFEIESDTELDYQICSGECVTIGSNDYCDPGTYTVTIPECTNGVNSFTINISVLGSDQVVIAPISNNLDCNNTSTTLDASGSSGLAGSSSYEWTGPGFSSDNAVVDVNVPGWYTFEIISPIGCQTEDSIEVIGDLSEPDLAIAPLGVWDCISSNITITGSSSVFGSSYLWTGPGTNTPFNQASVSSPGTYQLLVTGPNGCTTSDELTIPADYFIVPEATTSVTNMLDCYTTEATLVGSTNIGGADYLWTGPGVNESNPSVTVNEPGIYNFLVTSPAGCSSSASIEVFADATPPDIFAEVSSPVDCSTGTIQLNGFSTVDVPIYTWTGPSTFEESENINVTLPGTYTFAVINQENGCTASADVIITEEELTVPTFISVTEPDAIDCINTLALLFGESDLLSPIYLWTGPAGFEDDNSQNTSTTMPGMYIFTVTSANGCSLSETVEVFENTDNPDLLITSDGSLGCDGGEVILTGSTSVINSEFQWTGPSGSTNNNTLTVTEPGTYFLEIINLDNDCSSIDQIEITGDATPPVSDAGVGGVLDCTTASLTLNGGNSTGDNLIYQWLNSSNEEVGTLEELSVTVSDIYTLVVTNQTNGCTSIDEVEVTQDANVPTSNAGTDGVLDCTNASYVLSGGNSSGDDLTYQWLNSLDEEVGTEEELSVTVSGTYTLIVTNQTNGCTSIDEVEVTQDANVPTSDAGADGVLDCTNASLVLSGGNSSGDNLTYQWLNSSDEEVGTASELSVTVSDTYTLIVTNQTNGCTSIDEVVVTQDAAVPSSDAGTDGVLDCTNASYVLSGASSSGDNLTYQWLNSLDEEVGMAEELSVTVSDTYTLIVTNQTNGCTSIDDVEVTQDAAVPSSNAGADDVLDCTTASVILSGSNSTGGDLTYLWLNSSDEEVGTTEELSVTVSDTYTLVVTNQTNGC